MSSKGFHYKTIEAIIRGEVLEGFTPVRVVRIKRSAFYDSYEVTFLHEETLYTTIYMVCKVADVEREESDSLVPCYVVTDEL
ncbi:hypothetical protein BS042_RS19045 [Vibrio parahaemolyticus]|uniref:hypothetical protein n=1 Tax=Vibrio parahaemolyticus TaxID=670 RepID=UPI0004271D9C|nr:hypothetical protein [Vibrio parahaemolyticus]EJG1908102.1 hypothetical protein [Vibrio parahaemolyticus]MBM5063378.1 hypothetical protein [Vibrio parahaemolyticus]MCC4216112.1 hypothetical protein [Vibrio parahaemolyticus]